MICQRENDVVFRFAFQILIALVQNDRNSLFSTHIYLSAILSPI
jgi:hypothetical protein